MSSRLIHCLLTSIAIVALLLTAPVTHAGSVTYIYDELNRLKEAHYEDGTVIKYSYDGAGNRTALYVNTTPPVTTATPPGGAYNSARSVTLDCTDLSGAGCDKTYYCTSTDCEPTTQYSSPINISVTTPLRFFSTDLAQNSELVKTQIYTIDSTPPSNPTACTETHGAPNNGWQNSVSDPAFTWSGASDSGSGIKGYYWYFGTEGDTAPTIWTTSAGCDPSAVSSGTYYLRVKTEDNAGNKSTPATIFTFKYDVILPTGTVKINSDTPCTNSTGVTLSLTCNDNQGGSGCFQMQFSNDYVNGLYSTPEDYNASKSWSLSADNGTKTVYAQFKDVAGNWSNPTPDTITLNNRVILMSTPSAPYTSIQSAYNAATSNDTIKCLSTQFNESLITVNRNISVTLEGGYNCEFTSNTGNTTSVKGMIRTTAGGGTMTIKNFVLEK